MAFPLCPIVEERGADRDWFVSDTMGQARPLRCVVLCEGMVFPAWQAECLRQALASGHMEVVGLVERVAPPETRTEGKWAKRWRERKLAGWRVFERIFVKPFSKAIIPEDLTELLSEVPRHADTPRKVGRFGEALSEDTLDFVRALDPDVIVRFAYGILKGEVLEAARYGLWSFHHGDPSRFRGQPPGFWEMMHASPVAGAILQVLSEELDAGRILHRGNFQVTPHSYARTRDTLYFGTTPWLARACADVRLNGWQRVQSRHAGAKSDGPIFRQPRNGEVARFAVKLASQRLRIQLLYKFYRQQWNCAVIERPIADVAGLNGKEVQSRALASARWMSPPADEFFADPFGVALDDGVMRILVERYLWTEEKGVIAFLDFDGEQFSEARDAIVTTTHQSYPFIFLRKDQLLVIPEQSASGSLLLYGGLENNNLLPRQEVENAGELLDTTLFEYDGRVWAFALKEGMTRNTELHLYMVDSLTGPWRPHPLNPVKSDILSSRPAGTPFVVGKRLYRPGQDCASHYGSAISVNEVAKLSETDFEERVVTRVEPPSDGPFPYGLHTISQVGDRTLIDGAEKRARLRSGGA